MDSQERDHLQNMLRTYKRRFHALELKQAWYGINTPPEILMELEDLREMIDRCQSEIDSLPQTAPKDHKSGQSQREEFSSAGRKQIAITFNGSFDDLTPEKQNAVVRAIAGIVEISPDQVTVLKVMAGSIIFLVELPYEAADTWLDLYDSGNEIIKELNIEEIRVASKQELPLPVVAGNAAIEQKDYFSHRQTSAQFSFEMFRRAVLEQDDSAFKALMDIYGDIVKRWLKRWPARKDSEPLDVARTDELASSVFERFKTSLSPDKFEHFSDLRSILSYLQMCAHGVMTDYYRRSSFSEFEYEAAADQPYHKDRIEDHAGDDDILKSDEFWSLIKHRMQNEREWSVAYSSFFLDLRPREILEEYSDQFKSIEEIYRIKSMVMERLRRDPELRAYLFKDDV